MSFCWMQIIIGLIQSLGSSSFSQFFEFSMKISNSCFSVGSSWRLGLIWVMRVVRGMKPSWSNCLKRSQRLPLSMYWAGTLKCWMKSLIILSLSSIFYPKKLFISAICKIFHPLSSHFEISIQNSLFLAQLTKFAISSYSPLATNAVNGVNPLIL